MDYMIEEFDPFIFVLNQNGIWLRIHASWYDGSELAKAKLESAISTSKSRELKFYNWIEKFHLEFLGTGPNVAKYVPSLEVVDPPQVKNLREWLEIDGVKGDWESNRAGCKAWTLHFDVLHEDIYTLLGAHGLTLSPAEYVSEFLYNAFGILPSEIISLDRLREVLRQYEIEEISREDLIKSCGITTQALSGRIKNQGHPKPCRSSGKKQWFSVSAVEKWENARKN